MFSNFAWSEMLVIACVAIIVVGPKDLPGMLRSFGKTIGSIKRMAGDFRRQFDEAIREADLDDVRQLTSAKGFGPLEDAKHSMEAFSKSMNESVNSKSEAASAPKKSRAQPTKPTVSSDSALKGKKTALVAGKRSTAKSRQAAKKPAGVNSASSGSKVVRKPATRKKAVTGSGSKTKADSAS